MTRAKILAAALALKPLERAELVEALSVSLLEYALANMNRAAREELTSAIADDLDDLEPSDYLGARDLLARLRRLN